MEPDVKNLFNRAALFATVERNTHLDAPGEPSAAWYILFDRRSRPDLPDAFRQWSPSESGNPRNRADPAGMSLFYRCRIGRRGWLNVSNRGGDPRVRFGPLTVTAVSPSGPRIGCTPPRFIVTMAETELLPRPDACTTR
jgi:hypothetical protein